MLRPEVTWELHWNQLQRLAVRCWMRDGEVLAQLLEGGPTLEEQSTVQLNMLCWP